MRQRLRERFLQKQQLWQQHLGMHGQALVDGLNWVLLDVAVQQPFSSATAHARLSAALQQGLQRLQTSLADFDAFANGFESNRVFEDLGNMDSI